jgi:hypothetical protein
MSEYGKNPTRHDAGRNRLPTGEEGKGNRLRPEELGLLARDLAAAPDAIEAARLRERLTRGFYGV